MKSISEIRLANLELIIEEVGTAELVAERSGLSPVYISQIRSGAIDIKTGKRRNLGSVAARKLEKGAEKPAGWMDQDHNRGPDGNDRWPFPRIDPAEYEKLSDAQRTAIEDWVVDQVRSFLKPASLKSTDDAKSA